jgi:hypothetical protein
MAQSNDPAITSEEHACLEWISELESDLARAREKLQRIREALTQRMAECDPGPS